jgi:hypothetical protein
LVLLNLAVLWLAVASGCSSMATPNDSGAGDHFTNDLGSRADGLDTGGGLDALDDGKILVDGAVCESPATVIYREPGCGSEAHPSCLPPGPQDACASIVCSCGGVTIFGGCGYAREPFAHAGSCLTEPTDAGPALDTGAGDTSADHVPSPDGAAADATHADVGPPDLGPPADCGPAGTCAPDLICAEFVGTPRHTWACVPFPAQCSNQTPTFECLHDFCLSGGGLYGGFGNRHLTCTIEGS